MSSISTRPQWIEQVKNNPLVMRAVRYGGLPSLAGTLWLAIGLALLSLATSLAIFLQNPWRVNPVSLGLVVVAGAATLASPAITASTAAILTGRQSGSEEGQLLRLSSLPDAALVLGYMFAALYRLRLVLAVIVGLAPGLMVGMLHLHAHFRASTVCSRPCPGDILLNPLNVIGPLAIYASLLIEIAGINLAAVGLGVWLGLWSGKQPDLMAAALGLALLAGAVLVSLLVLRYGDRLPYDDPPTILAFVLTCWIPYALARATISLARRQARAIPPSAPIVTGRAF
jgi:hypothetical protein